MDRFIKSLPKGELRDIIRIIQQQCDHQGRLKKELRESIEMLSSSEVSETDRQRQFDQLSYQYQNILRPIFVEISRLRKIESSYRGTTFSQI